MDSCDPHSLSSLLVFKNTTNQEVIRSLHVYELEDGNENEVEREFMINDGYMWRNPKSKVIPNLAKDLKIVGEMACVKVEKEPLQSSDEETSQGNDGNHRHLRTSPAVDLDLNCPASPVKVSESSDDQESGKQTPGDIEKKTKRAASERISKITLQDLVKYFDVPIIEASRSLNVGLTVLKKKCREFGIPRWPHRKIKSLDSLNRDLQEETEFQQKENKDAALAVAKRQKMLEREREIIERKPFLDMKIETKRFRQDVFKRRHKARALKSQGSSLSSL